jgi:glycosyltransferase involved in cell wall biosynthesis
MRILFIVTGLGLGGAEAMLVKLLARIDHHRFHPTVISLTETADVQEQIHQLGIEVYPLDLQSVRGLIFGVFRLIRLVWQIRPNIIQGWMLHGNLAALFAGACSRIPVFWGIRHSWLLSKKEKNASVFLERILGWVSRFPARIVYNSKEGKRYHEGIGYSSKRSLVIPNGFDLEKFAPSSTIRQTVRRSLAIAEEAVVIGMIARYHPMKDHRTFLEAAALLRKFRLGVVFLLVGRGCEETNGELISVVNSLSLGDAVRLIGERADVHELINAFDIGTLSSSSEGFANAIGELMCCAVPCVVTDVGDSGWIVGDSGVTVPPQDPVSLSRGWTLLLDAGPSIREAMGRRARERIIARFSIDAVAKEYESVYLQYQ